jgi:hypothetical protein
MSLTLLDGLTLIDMQEIFVRLASATTTYNREVSTLCESVNYRAGGVLRHAAILGDGRDARVAMAVVSRDVG